LHRRVSAGTAPREFQANVNRAACGAADDPGIARRLEQAKHGDVVDEHCCHHGRDARRLRPSDRCVDEAASDAVPPPLFGYRDRHLDAGIADGLEAQVPDDRGAVSALTFRYEAFAMEVVRRAEVPCLHVRQALAVRAEAQPAALGGQPIVELLELGNVPRGNASDAQPGIGGTAAACGTMVPAPSISVVCP
jgi:hypothetical protein